MNVKELSESEQPREKLKHYGVRDLSDQELLAILLGSGIKGKPITDWKIRHADIVKGGELVFEMGK